MKVLKVLRVGADFPLPADSIERANRIGRLVTAWSIFLDEAAAMENGAAEPEPAAEPPMRVSGGIGQSQALDEAVEKIRRNAAASAKAADKLVRRSRRRGRPLGSRNKPKPAEAAPVPE